MKLIELTEKLVGFDTVSNNSNKEMADFLSEYLESKGFKIETYPYKDAENQKKINLIARKGGEESKLALSGHMDTVPYKGNWEINSDPLELTEFNGNFYGRGAVDMKHFIALAIKAGEKINETGLKYPFCLCFTSEEEIGCKGARNLLKEHSAHVAENIIIGEPTDLKPIRAHKGYIYAIVELRGERGHSSNPQKEKSVFYALEKIIAKLKVFELKLEGISVPDFNPPYPTMNVGVITTDEVKKSGEIVKSSKNVIPGYCKLEMEIRPVPGQKPEQIFYVLKEMLKEKIGEVEVQIKLARKPTPPMETPKDSKIVRIAEELSGCPSSTVAYNTEGGVFNKAGYQSVIWGPGSIKQAHKSNEFIEAKYFQEKIVDLYTEAIRRICG